MDDKRFKSEKSDDQQEKEETDSSELDRKEPKGSIRRMINDLKRKRPNEYTKFEPKKKAQKKSEYQ